MSQKRKSDAAMLMPIMAATAAFGLAVGGKVFVWVVMISVPFRVNFWPDCAGFPVIEPSPLA